MGADSSKSHFDTRQIDVLLKKYMPVFLESEYCNVGEREWVDPMSFWIAFHSYLASNNIGNLGVLSTTNVEFVKYYFHRLYDKHDIYVTGSCSSNILVGVSIGKWPGTKHTDRRAIYETDLPRMP